MEQITHPDGEKSPIVNSWIDELRRIRGMVGSPGADWQALKATERLEREILRLFT